MKKTYIHPELKVVVMKSTQALMVGSVRIDSVVMNDVEYEGDACGLEADGREFAFDDDFEFNTAEEF